VTRLRTIGLLACLLAACGSSDGPAGGDAGDAVDAAAGAVTRAPVTITTSDGLDLAGYLATGPDTPIGSPGVLLVHQYQRDKEQWGDLPEELAGRGYRVLAIDLRGHGESDPYTGGSLVDLLTDPDGAPRDVDAALAYLAGDGGADSGRIGVVGTSIGANLTVAAAVRDQAATYVSLSSRQSSVEIFAGAAATGMASVFYLASEGDSGGVQAADAQTMYDNTSEPRQIHVYAGVSDHGVAILDNHADARGLVVDWLGTTL